jgi:hypothetical protein
MELAKQRHWQHNMDRSRSEHVCGPIGMRMGRRLVSTEDVSNGAVHEKYECFC